MPRVWLRASRCDLAQIVVEAAGELGPVSAEHEITLDVQPAIVEGARDELHRLAMNLLENALRHTPPGTEIHVSTAMLGDGQVELVVEDDGPGVPAELAPTLFERFVRGAGERGGSFGLGLAIVQRRGATRTAARSRSRARSVTRAARDRRALRRAPTGATQTSTTTGSTIGRRLRRS